MPFWHGDRPGRPLELGRALGGFVREIRDLDPAAAIERLSTHYSLDAFAANNLVQYIAEQVEATGAVPDDRTIVVERFRDEIGDWRVCILSPFGTPVHAPWAMAIERRLADQFDLPVESMWGDDGIVIRLPESADELPLEAIVIDPDDIDELVVSTLPQTALFSSRFRECAGRALLLPRRRPDRRTPLWQQRQRAADLLAVASKYPTFPILLEASRECLQDVFDVPALREVLGQLRSRAIRVVNVDTGSASPMASSLLFNWIAAYMYEGDAPLAERRAAALALDRDLLRDLLGAEELRELLDADVLADVELELQCLADHRRARSVDELHDVLRRVGDLSSAEVDLRCEGSGAAWIGQLIVEKRAIEIAVGGETRYAAGEDAARYRDALGCSLPLGLPMAFTDPVARPLEELVGRYARTHGPFLVSDVTRRFGSTNERVAGAIAALEADDRVVLGEFRPDGVAREYCDVDVLRQLRRRSLAALRREVEAVDQAAFARFLPAWQNIPADRRGVEALVEALGMLSGAALVASSIETDVLPARVGAYDRRCSTSSARRATWCGSAPVRSVPATVASGCASPTSWRVLAPSWEQRDPPEGPLHDALRELLGAQGASFWGQLRAAGPASSDQELLAALWDLVWAGEVTNDSLAPIRAVLGGASPKAAAAHGAARLRGRPRPGRLNRIGPPAGQGRWSLVAPLLLPAPTPTESAHAQALQLVERYGVVTREAVLAEGVVGGFANVYGVLKVLEERGQVRRGYFVDGLGAAQFAVPGAVDRLRAVRETPDPVIHPDDVPAPIVLAATDPAQPYGAALAWPDSPGRPSRSANALVVLRAGEALAWFDRKGRHLVTFPATKSDGAWADALVSMVKDGRASSVEVRKVDGATLAEAPPDVLDRLRAAGFSDGYRGLVFRG